MENTTQNKSNQSTVTPNTKPSVTNSPFDANKLTQNHAKKYKGKEEFVTTTSFFIDQLITNKQVVSLHHAMLDLDVIHTINNCSTQLGNTCKQTLETLKIIHTQFDIPIQDDDTLKPLLDSYFVGVYHSKASEKISKEIPVFLNIHGDFKDYRHQYEYWVDYKTNIKNEQLIKKPTTLYDMNTYKIFNYISKLKTMIENTTDQKKIDKLKTIIQQYDNMKQNKRTYYSFIYKNDFDTNGGFDVLGQPFIYTNILFNSYTKSLLETYGDDFSFKNTQKEKIKSQLFEIDILKKTLEIKSTIEKHPPNSILVGISEYTRNHPSRYIFLNDQGSFVDSLGNFFWPLYETTVVKIIVNNQKKPYGVYLFQKVKTDNIGKEKFKEELVAYNYYFHYPQNKSWDETTNAVTQTIKTSLFYLAIGLTIDAALLYNTYLQEASKSAANHVWLQHNHAEYLKDRTALKDSTSSSSQTTSTQNFVNNYKEMVKEQAQLKAQLASSTGSTQSFYKSIFEHHHNECMNSIQELMKNYPDYNFPPPSSFTGSPCQLAFVHRWQDAYNHLYNNSYGDGSGIGDTGGWITHGSASESKLVFERISHHVSDVHAHNNIVHDKIIMDKYLNTVSDPEVLNTINSATHTAVGTTNSLKNTTNNAVETIANTAASSIAVYNDKNSDFRKKSDKEVAAFSIASELDKTKSKLEFNKFLIGFVEKNPKPNLNQQSVEELKQENTNIQKQIDVLSKLQELSNSKEGIETISQ